MFWERSGNLVVERPSSSDVPPMPWEREPQRLWSRLDMKPIRTAEIARAIANIATARGNAATVPLADRLVQEISRMMKDQLAKSNVRLDVIHTHPEAVGEAVKPMVIELLEAAEEGLQDAALPKRFYNKIERVKAHLVESDDFDGIDTRARLEE
jgi:hypothetical protein